MQQFSVSHAYISFFVSACQACCIESHFSLSLNWMLFYLWLTFTCYICGEEGKGAHNVWVPGGRYTRIDLRFQVCLIAWACFWAHKRKWVHIPLYKQHFSSPHSLLLPHPLHFQTSLTLTFLSSLYRGLCDGVVVWVRSFGEFRCGSVLVLVVFERQRRAMA